MSMGDENKDGKLKFKEWLTAGSIWDLAFGRAMIDCLTEGWFSLFSLAVGPRIPT